MRRRSCQFTLVHASSRSFTLVHPRSPSFTLVCARSLSFALGCSRLLSAALVRFRFRSFFARRPDEVGPQTLCFCLRTSRRNPTSHTGPTWCKKGQPGRGSQDPPTKLEGPAGFPFGNSRLREAPQACRSLQARPAQLQHCWWVLRTTTGLTKVGAVVTDGRSSA